jgi:hypothetical protein
MKCAVHTENGFSYFVKQRLRLNKLLPNGQKNCGGNWNIIVNVMKLYVMWAFLYVGK